MLSPGALSPDALTGVTRAHVAHVPDIGCALHESVIPPFRAMRVAAWAEAGIDLAAVSGFRDFDRQRSIWNAKMRGERPLLGRAGDELDAAALDLDGRIDAILLWSALPGASRHHWGTDVDVVDRAGMPPGYEPQLTPLEYGPDGPFASLDSWLTANMHRFGFYRPYVRDLGGVQPEPWHLSYLPIAGLATHALSQEVLRVAIESGAIEGGPRVLERLPELHARYVLAVEPWR